MVSIGICGASGCGKTFLVKQLAAINCTASLPEGEIGTFPPKVIKQIQSKTQSVQLFRWFTNQYKQRLALANNLSKRGILCFVDGCKASIPAHKVIQKPELFKSLEKVYSTLNYDVDYIILLTLSRRKFQKLIKNRGRVHEQTNEYMNRSMLVQNEFLKILGEKKNVLIINRDKYDFTKYGDVSNINKKIINFVKRFHK